MQESTTASNQPGNLTHPKPYHTPSFTRLGKVEQLTNQTTRPTTTKAATPTPSKNGRAS